ncbi:MAG: acyltransferase [Eubacteriales bacterium]
MSKKIYTLDIYKALAAFMVILIHVTATPVVTLTSGNTLTLLLAINRFAKPSVPMFIFASGMSLFYVYKDKNLDYFKFLRKRFMRILVPYLFFCIIYYAYYVSSGTYAFSWEFFIGNVFSGKLIYHLYFVVIIIQFYLLYGLFHQVVNRYKPLLIIPATAILSLISINIVQSEWVGRFFGTYALYFVIGCYFGKEYEKTMAFMNKYKWPIFIAFICSGGLYAYQFYQAQVLKLGYPFISDSYAFLIFSSIACMTYFIIAGIIENIYQKGRIKEARNFLLSISAASYYIYLSHPLGIIAGVSISNRLGIEGVVGQMFVSLLVIGVVVIPLCLAYVVLKKSFSKNNPLNKHVNI